MAIDSSTNTTTTIRSRRFALTMTMNTTTAEERRFQEYASQLTLLDDFIKSLRRDGLQQDFRIANAADLTDHTLLPGKNSARVVLGAPYPPHRHVFKGFDLAAYMKHGPNFHQHQRDTMLHEIRTLAAMPAHPNIMPCPEMLVVIRDAEGAQRVCGFLQPVMERETLDDQVVKANRAGKRISLARKANWCHGMARAILHTHRIGQTYHMDVKPGNMLIDDDDGVRLIDWEQSGVSMFTHAKEVTIDQEAHEVDEPTGKYTMDLVTGETTRRRKIVYTPHQGPKRVNLPWGFPDWNVFLEWHKTCPRAAELAEVFSLGRVMWMLLEQLEQTPEPTRWTERSDDIPRSWVDMSKRCQAVDPNDRPELDEVVEFWRQETERYAVADKGE